MKTVKKFLEDCIIGLAAYFLWLALIIINRSVRIIYREKHSLAEIKTAGHRLIYVLWHGQTFVPFYYIYRMKSRMALLTTAARRGRVLNGAVSRLGFRIVSLPGFTPSKAWLTELMKLIALVKEGYDAGVVLDGPFGPALEIKPGAFLVAAKTGDPIIPVGIAFQRCLTLFWRWDRYQVPLPFSRVAIVCGSPIYFNEEISTENIEAAKIRLKSTLDELNSKAASLVREPDLPGVKFN